MSHSQVPKKRRPIVFVLDNIRSAHNVGAAFRIGDAFWITKIYCCGITPTPPHPQIRKTALGAEETIPFDHAEHTPSLLTSLQKQGYKLIAIEQTDKAIPLHQAEEITQETKPTAFIFGHEVLGINQEVLDHVDKTLLIPQHGTKQSLNVATCIGIVAWEMLKNY